MRGRACVRAHVRACARERERAAKASGWEWRGGGCTGNSNSSLARANAFKRGRASSFRESLLAKRFESLSRKVEEGGRKGTTSGA